MPLDVSQPPPFSVVEEPSSVSSRWKKWHRTFQFYLDATGVTNAAQKRALLLHVAGPEVQDIFTTLPQPLNTLDEVLTALTTYFSPQVNVRYERVMFRQIKQDSGETTDRYVTRLRKLAESCEFQDPDDAILDQVIEKCFSTELRRKALQEKNLTLDKFLHLARALEAANRQASIIEGNGNNNSKQVNKVQQSKPAKKSNQSNKKAKPEVKKDKVNVSNTKSCTRCGSTKHTYLDLNDCPAKDKKCLACGRLNHFQQYCKAKAKRQVYNVSDTTSSDITDSKAEEEQNFAFSLNTSNTQKRRIILDIQLNGQVVPMQLDTGSDVCIISEEVAKTLPNLTVFPSPGANPILDYNGEKIEIVGTATVDVSYLGINYKDLPISVAKGQRRGLFGLEWVGMVKTGVDLDNLYVNKVQTVQPEEDLDKLLKKYDKIFDDKQGTVKGVKASLLLKADANPKFCPPRQIPFALKPQVEQEIQRLIDNQSFEKVTYSDWGTPIVPVVKSDGSIRLCGDYKVTVNPQLQVAQHPLPKPEDMFAALGNCKVFSKIDLKQAFQQLIMTDESQNICTLSTHLGLFRPKRLPYGIASSPALWQLTMDKMFSGLQGTFCFVDDILVAGRTYDEHLSRLKAVLSIIEGSGMKIRKDKCKFAVTSVEYLGFKIDGSGIHKTTGKVKAIQQAKLPSNVTELKAFMGLVTFYGRFIPNLATIAHPLHNLLKKDVEWCWTDECDEAVNKIKIEITSPRFLTHFQPDLPVKLTCDASAYGIGAVLAHVMPDSTERPIAFASRSLNAAERNYSQIQKEALALVYGVTKFHMYLYGKQKFTLVTDHKPLLAILGPKKGLPALVAARLQRWAVILAAYTYDLEYKDTNKIGNADALSRFPVDAAPESNGTNILLVESHNLPITAKMIKQATKEDPVLSRVMQGLVTGRGLASDQEDYKPYLRVWSELTVEDGCILRGARVVVPEKLRQTLLKEIHADHQGILKSKSIARTYVWWPGMDNQLETYIKGCSSCSAQQNMPTQKRMHPWEQPRHAWQRLHLDFLGPFLNHTFLVIVDAYSKWPEVIPMKSTTTHATIAALMPVFATHGLPVRIVTDNGPQFTSNEFADFLKVNGILHTRSAPYHPSSNGEAERLVQTFKHNMKCRKATPMDIITNTSKFLLSYRTTDHSTTGQTPSQMLMGRRIRSKLDLLMPNYQENAHTRELQQMEKQGKVPTYTPSSSVWVRSYNTSDKWVPGVITKALGNMHYEVQVDNSITTRHVDQLRPSVTDPDGNSPEFIPSHDIVQLPPAPQAHVSPTDQHPTDDVTSRSVSPPKNSVDVRVLPPRSSRNKPPNRLDL